MSVVVVIVIVLVAVLLVAMLVAAARKGAAARAHAVDFDVQPFRSHAEASRRDDE